MTRISVYSLPVLLLLTATVATAQFSPGSRFIGGGFSLAAPLAPKLANTINVTLQPEFGHFRTENVAAGFTATVAYGHSNVSDTRTNSSVTVGVGPFIQRFLPIVDRFGFVLTGRSSLSVTSTTAKTTGSSPTSNATLGVGLGLSGSPGMFYSVSERWLLVLDLGAYQALSVTYSSQKTTPDPNDVRNSTFSYGIGRTFSLSSSAIRIRYFL